jgi:hypothetical protein
MNRRNAKNGFGKEGVMSNLLGDSFSPPSLEGSDAKVKYLDNVARDYVEKAKEEMISCKTQRQLLEKESQMLAECSLVASMIFQKNPIPDHAYQLSALANAHRSALAQLEKMADPETNLKEISKVIRDMYMLLIQSMTSEVDKLKREFVNLYPNEKSTLDDMFRRLTISIQPETRNLFQGLDAKLKKALSIKGSAT